MSTLIIAEHDKATLQSNFRHVLNAALQFKDSVVALVMGHQCHLVAQQVASFAGVETVLLADNPCYAHQLAENCSPLVKELAPSFKRILAPSSTFGKNLLPRIAALLDCAQISDVTKINSEDTFEHPIYAGNAIETVKVLDPIKLLTIRSTAFDAVRESQTPCPIEQLGKVIENTQVQFISHQLNQSTRPELANAKIIVSGGRGLQNAEKFTLIEQLADALGAAIGASRAAVDAGFVSNDYQVGQTGKVVAPDLYIAVGISGAVQHLAGMKDSKVIVAINKDEDAPIFQVADYGLVGDLFVLVPELIAQLKQS